MPNIVMIVQEYYPKDIRVRKEAIALSQIGHQIDIICLQGNNESANDIIEGIGVHRISLTKKRGSKFRYIYEYFSFFVLARSKLKELLRNKKVDIVHVHTLPDFLVFVAAPARRQGAKVVLDMHEIWPEFFMSKYSVSARHPIIKFLKIIERKSLEFADQVITINEPIKRIFLKRAKIRNTITVIMNTVDEELLPKLPKNRSEKFIGIYHGTITNTYNLEFVIRSLPDIAAKIPNFEFHIYGDGPDLKNLEETVESLKLNDAVFLHGHIDFAKISEILSRAQLGILPMKRDIMLDLSFSNKIAEYIYCEIPVLCSDLPGVMEYFPPDTINYFESENKLDFQNKLIDIYNNYDQNLKQVKKAYEIYKTISWGVMKARLQEMTSIVLNQMNNK